MRPTTLTLPIGPISRIGIWLPVALASLLWLFPQLAGACAVCYSGREETREAFLVTTLLLSVLPLAMIGSLVFWLRRRALALRRQSGG